MSFFKSITKVLNKPAVKVGLAGLGAASGFGAFDGVGPMFGSSSDWLKPESLIGFGNIASGAAGLSEGGNTGLNLAQMGLGGFNVAQGVGGVGTFQSIARDVVGGGARTTRTAPSTGGSRTPTTTPTLTRPGAPHMPATSGYVPSPAAEPFAGTPPIPAERPATPWSFGSRTPTVRPPTDLSGLTPPVSGPIAATDLSGLTPRSAMPGSGGPHMPSTTTNPGVTLHQSMGGNPDFSQSDILYGGSGSHVVMGDAGSDIIGGGAAISGSGSSRITQASAAAANGSGAPVANTPDAKPWFDRMTDSILSNPLNAVLTGSVLVSMFEADPAQEAAQQYADDMERFARQSDPGSPQGQAYISAYEAQRNQQLDHEYEKAVADFEVWATERGMQDSTVYTDGMAALNAQYSDLRTRIPLEAQQAFLDYQNARFSGLANASTVAGRGAQIMASQAGPMDFSQAGTIVGASLAG